MGRRVASSAIGGFLVLLGLAEFLAMRPSVAAATLQNADAMGAVLGIQLFIGLFLIVYAVFIAGNHPFRL